jgi:GDPmannose 4,6-dehydratase
MRALVTGISGQDGHYITKQLINNGYEVIGLTSSEQKIACLEQEFKGLPVRIKLFDFYKRDLISDLLVETRPDRIYNFAAKATGQGMFDSVGEMSRLNGEFVLDILQGIKNVNPEIRFCQASSAEMFGKVTESPQNENTLFKPLSPYGAAKLYAHNLVSIYRNAYNLHCSSAILFNHESPRRSVNFVTRKIASAAASIKLGYSDSLSLGALDAQRDWGYAQEYVDAMYRMTDADHADDYVVSTGILTSVRTLCQICFDHVGLNYRDFVRVDEALKRPVATTNVIGDSGLIKKKLGWEAKVHIEQIATEMVDIDLELFRVAGHAGN